jgi:hypothetical protein
MHCHFVKGLVPPPTFSQLALEILPLLACVVVAMIDAKALVFVEMKEGILLEASIGLCPKCLASSSTCSYLHVHPFAPTIPILHCFVCMHLTLLLG